MEVIFTAKLKPPKVKTSQKLRSSIGSPRWH
jgi:hypothetical protein